MFQTEVAVDASIPTWVALLLAALSALLGSGGVAAILKARYDHKQGVEAGEVVEDDAIASRWEALSKAQVEILLNPLKERLAEVEQKVSALEAELDRSRKKYWAAIPYIRVLLSLFHRHAPDVTVPQIPATIAEDV